MATGLWNIGKYNLPDFGITEKLGLTGMNNPAVAPNATGLSSPGKLTQQSTPVKVPVINSNSGAQYGSMGPVGYGIPGTFKSSSTTPGGNQGGSGNGGDSRQTQLEKNQSRNPSEEAELNALRSQLDSGNNQIEADYNNFLNSLNSQEQGLRNEAPLAEQRTVNNYAPVKSDIQNQGTQKIAGLEGQATTVNTQKASQLQQARDLYRQINQQNTAQLSGLGISSSSVAEALAENLGVETARRISSVSQSADDVIRGIEKEKTNVNDYVNTKMTEVDNTIATEKQGIQEKLRQGLDQINQARQLAATDKANRRQDLLMQAQSAMAQLQQNAQNFQQSLEMWKAQTTNGLSQAANQDWETIFAQKVAPIYQSYQDLGQTAPDMTTSYNPKTGYDVSIKPNTKKEDIYSQYGITQ